MEKSIIGSFYSDGDSIGMAIGESPKDGHLYRGSETFFENIIKLAFLTKFPKPVHQGSRLIHEIDLDIDTEKYKTNPSDQNFNKNIKKEHKILIRKVQNFSAPNTLVLKLECYDNRLTCEFENDNFIYWTYQIARAYFDNSHLVVKFDSNSNEIIDLVYPAEKININDPSIKPLLIHEVKPKKKTSSKYTLPNHPLLKEINNTDLEWYSVTYFTFSKESKYYFSDTTDWMMTFWQDKFSEKDGIEEEFFPEERIRNYFKENEVNLDDLRQTLMYLLDIEEFEKAEAFLPSFYFNYEKKEFISFFRATDRYVESVLEGWTGEHRPFFDLIPDELKYWIIDGKDWSTVFFLGNL